ncbi:hydantoinase B/oxoprolinase family protein [Acidianus sp. RZ1]|nr:5-oxoprolinase [Acidianus sp. RZ1]
MVSWEIIHKAMEFIAEEMGVALKKSSMSPNIRERMDHSCAIMDPMGNLVTQAEHIPVHLGSFRIGVRNLLDYMNKEGLNIEEGDVIVLNDPYISGTHLNDVMMVSPIYCSDKLVGYAVNKAHHVDVGGPVPGSINPNATTLYEEGLIIPPTYLMEKGKLNRDVLDLILSNFKSPYTSIGDLNAQIAANRLGILRVSQLIDKYGLESVRRGWEESITYSRDLSTKEIEKWPKGTYSAMDYLEGIDGNLIKIKVNIAISENKIIADFNGADPQLPQPLNAVYGVTFSATTFVIRSLIGKEIPTNEGFYSLIEVRASEGLLVNPIKPAPVSGGNVETTQRIADTVFKSLSNVLPDKVPAAGSGTMMNVMLGGYYKGSYWAHYETIGGGTGGRPNKDGVSGVHVNMTNTLNTPIEIAEKDYPLLFTAYHIRYGSGGDGKHKGGDGIVRAFKILAETKLSILGDRFKVPPWGLFGGKSGSIAKVTIKRKEGKIEEISGKFTTTLYEGDEVIIETPGGGGFGSK